MALRENERDAHIKAIYYILIPFAAISIIGLFVGLAAFNMRSAPHDMDAITISLTVIEIVLAIFAIMLGIVAIFGFWAVRGAAVAAAKREAKSYLDLKATEMFAEVAKTRQNQPNQKEAADIPSDLNQDEVLNKATEATSDDGNQD